MNVFRFIAWGLALASPTVLLYAQDATVGPFSWLDADEHPDELPVPKFSVHVAFPAELRNTPDIGYVVLKRPIDPKGKAMPGIVAGTLPAYTGAVESALADRPCTPGRRGGQPVVSLVQQAVIFNPASAAVGKPDATPRLLDVCLVEIKVERAAMPTTSRKIVWCRLSLDATGKVTAVQDAPGDYADVIERAVQRWKFAPARQGGQPVPAEIRVPCILEWERVDKAYDTPPRIIRRVEPEYPPRLSLARYRGDVLVAFTVDTDGRVKNPQIVRSLNHEFDEAALTAIQQFRFEPARLRGVPVAAKFGQEFNFQMKGLPDGGDDGISMRGRVDTSTLPPELRYDVAPKLLGVVLPVYPYAALREDRRGKATVTMMVDADGRVIQTRVQSASAPEYGWALQAAVDVTAFSPALRGGHPTKTAIAISWDFNPLTSDELVKARDFELLRQERKHPEKIASVDQLDAPLHAVADRQPKYPTGAKGTIEHPSAEVEFLVDTDGAVHLVRIVSAPQEVFGYAAAQAVASWRYDPPTLHGKPAVVRVRGTVDFEKGKLTTPAPAPGQSEK